MANGINRYDQPAQSQFINTYVPIPFDVLAQAGMARQQRHDQVMEQELEFDPTAGPSLKYITTPMGEPLEVGDRAAVETAQQEFENRLSNLSQLAGTTDRGDPRYQRELRSLYRDLAKARSSAGVFGRAKANVERYKQIQEQIAENPDVQKAPWLANQLEAQIRQFADASRQGAGIADLQAPAGIGEYVDRTAEFNDAIKNINSIILDIVDTPAEALMNNPGYIKTGKFSGIPRSKIQDAARAYLKTNNSVTQDLAQQREYLENYTDMSDAEIEQIMQREKQELENYLVSIYTESDATYNFKSDAEYGRKADEDNQIETLLGTFRPNLIESDIFNIDQSYKTREGSSTNDGLYYDKNGNIKPYDVLTVSTTQRGYSVGTESGNYTYDNFVSDLSKQLGREPTLEEVEQAASGSQYANFAKYAKTKKEVNRLRNKYNVPESVNDKSLVSAYQNKVNELATISASVNRPSTSKTENITKLNKTANFLFGDDEKLGDLASSNRVIHIQEGSGKQTASGDWKTFVKALGFRFRKDLNKNVKESATVTGFKVFDDQLPGAIEFEIKNKKGELVKGVVEPSLQMQTVVQPAYDIYNAYKFVVLGDEQSVTIPYGPNDYVVESKWEQGKFKTSIREVDRQSGESRRTTLNEIGNAVARRIIEKNLF